MLLAFQNVHDHISIEQSVSLEHHAVFIPFTDGEPVEQKRLTISGTASDPVSRGTIANRKHLGELEFDLVNGIQRGRYCLSDFFKPFGSISRRTIVSFARHCPMFAPVFLFSVSSVVCVIFLPLSVLRLKLFEYSVGADGCAGLTCQNINGLEKGT